jgi:hypothetical protein
VSYAQWGYSSVVEHSTADREVTGSNPVAPFFSILFFNFYKLKPFMCSFSSISVSKLTCMLNNEDVICLIYGEQNETDLTTEQEESLVIRSMFSSNIYKFFEVLSDRFQDSVFLTGRKNFKSLNFYLLSI